jgi:hypothetical protein
MTETTNRRHENRVPISLKAYYSFGRVDGVGVLADLSYSGALIEDISTRPPEIGTPIVLCVYLVAPRGLEEVTPFKLTGHVVQHNSTGFAVKYEDNHDPDVRRMLDDAAAIVAVPR